MRLSDSFRLALLVAPLLAAPARAETDGQRIRDLLGQLDSPQYGQREAATRRLMGAGAGAIAPLAEAAAAGRLEVTVRAVKVLAALAQTDEEATGQRAKDALRRLAENSSGAASEQAQTALAAVHRWEARRAVEVLTELGAEIEGVPDGEEPIAVRLQKKWRGEERHLALLSRLKGLEQLSVYGVPLTDAAAPPLAALESLSRLELYGTEMTNEAAERIREALPGVSVEVRRGGLLGVSGSIAAQQCQFTTVREGSAAEKAGLQVGDICLECEGKPVGDFRELTDIIATKKGGEKISLVIDRDRERLKFDVELDEWGDFVP